MGAHLSETSTGADAEGQVRARSGAIQPDAKNSLFDVQRDRRFSRIYFAPAS